MSNIKRNNKWGGKRKGAGHPESGVTKVKLSISVNERVFRRAKRRWRGQTQKPKTSRLLEKLLDLYASNVVSLEVSI